MTRGRKRRRIVPWLARARSDTSAASARQASGGRRRRLLILCAGAAAALATVLALTLFMLSRPAHAPTGPRAAIIDELAVTDPNPALIKQATDLLTQDGYVVDHFPTDKVTVDLYRDLPSRGYRYIIIRSHSYGNRVSTDSTIQLNFVGVFTSEGYSPKKHVAEQRGRLLDVAFFPERQGRYFGINQDFVQTAMRGRFDGTTVILTGCSGLSSDGLARAFIEKGAATFVSWDREVSAAHTDAATQRLLQHLLADRLDSTQAVAKTMAEVGPDPAFHSRLLAYP